MQEIFYEESSLTQNEKSAKTRYNVFKIFSIISYCCAAFWIFMFLNFYSLKDFSFLAFAFSVLLPVALFIASGVFLGRFKNKMFVDYDYTFVTGSVRISKVIKHTKRKNLLKFETSAIIQMGKYGSDSYLKIEKSPNVKKMILTSNVTPSEGKDFYYLYVNTDGGNKLLVFDCTEMFMATVLRYSNKTILEKDFK